MNTQQDIEKIKALYSSAIERSRKSGNIARVCPGVYMLATKDIVWQIWQMVETPGRPWMACDYHRQRSVYTDPYETLSDAKSSLLAP